MTPPAATKKKPAKKAANKSVKLVIGTLRKEKEIDVTEGITVGEAVKMGGYTVPADRTAEQENWRLNGRKCKWTDRITGKDPSLYQLEKVQAGQE